MIKIYGIKNCDTMKKAMKWMEVNDIEFTFHDYRKDGIDAKMVEGFISNIGLELVINKRGTTWRMLPDEIKNDPDENKLVKLLVENEAIIKRPIFDLGGDFIVGFTKNEQARLEDKLIK